MEKSEAWAAMMKAHRMGLGYLVEEDLFGYQITPTPRSGLVKIGDFNFNGMTLPRYELRAAHERNQVRRLGGNGLKVQDITDLDGQQQRVLELMLDGAWHTRDEIERAAGAAEGMRRMRELRQHFIIDRYRAEGSREFRYRLVERRRGAA